MINEVIEEEDEDKNNKKDIHHIINNNFHNNRIGLKKTNSNSIMNNYMKNVERKINWMVSGRNHFSPGQLNMV